MFDFLPENGPRLHPKDLPVLPIPTKPKDD